MIRCVKVIESKLLRNSLEWVHDCDLPTRQKSQKFTLQWVVRADSTLKAIESISIVSVQIDERTWRLQVRRRHECERRKKVLIQFDSHYYYGRFLYLTLAVSAKKLSPDIKGSTLLSPVTMFMIFLLSSRCETFSEVVVLNWCQCFIKIRYFSIILFPVCRCWFCFSSSCYGKKKYN